MQTHQDTEEHIHMITYDKYSAICFADHMKTYTSGNSSSDTSLIRDIYCGPEALFETCVTMKFLDDDDDDEDDISTMS